MRPPHLQQLLEYLDTSRTLINRMTSSAFDPSNELHAYNAKAMLKNGAVYFEQTENTLKDQWEAERAIDALLDSCGRHDPLAFEDAKAVALRAVDDLEVSLTIASPNNLARAMGLV